MEKVIEMPDISFEEALKELENLVRQLEEGKISLEQAVSAYERGMKLKNHCEEKLHQARMRVEQITLTPENDVLLKPLNKPFEGEA
ncbi:MAG: exodeoxyribonuclease VII small subunit [Holosporales bacterium]|jgi:exodeoxyribonuclease VII small subunit